MKTFFKWEVAVIRAFIESFRFLKVLQNLTPLSAICLPNCIFYSVSYHTVTYNGELQETRACSAIYTFRNSADEHGQDNLLY